MKPTRPDGHLHILDFLRARPLIKIGSIESQLGITRCNLVKAIAGTRPLPEKYIQPLEKILQMMKENNKGKDKYRRYNAAIPLLESLIRDFKDENLKCILFGH